MDLLPSNMSLQRQVGCCISDKLAFCGHYGIKWVMTMDTIIPEGIECVSIGKLAPPHLSFKYCPMIKGIDPVNIKMWKIGNRLSDFGIESRVLYHDDSGNIIMGLPGMDSAFVAKVPKICHVAVETGFALGLIPVLRLHM